LTPSLAVQERHPIHLNRYTHLYRYIHLNRYNLAFGAAREWVSASQLCSVEKLEIGKGGAGPGTNSWTNPVWPKAGPEGEIVIV
jgi:hypothetical protein